MSLSETAAPQPAERPTGVWFLTVSNAIFAGFVPIFSLYLSRQTGYSVDLSLLNVVANIILPVLIMVTAFFAWRGNKYSRMSLVFYLVLRYGATVLYTLTHESNPGWTGSYAFRYEMNKFAENAVLPLLWAGINTWYFLGRKSAAFYAVDTNERPRPGIRETLATVPAWLWGSISGVLVFYTLLFGLSLLEPRVSREDPIYFSMGGFRELCHNDDTTYYFWIEALLFPARFATGDQFGAFTPDLISFACVPFAFTGALLFVGKQKRMSILVVVFVLFLALCYFYIHFLVAFGFGSSCAG